MTEREMRNEEMKKVIRHNAEQACEFIDALELELKQREAMNKKLAEQIDQKRQGKAA